MQIVQTNIGFSLQLGRLSSWLLGALVVPHWLTGDMTDEVELQGVATSAVVVVWCGVMWCGVL